MLARGLVLDCPPHKHISLSHTQNISSHTRCYFKHIVKCPSTDRLCRRRKLLTLTVKVGFLRFRCRTERIVWYTHGTIIVSITDTDEIFLESHGCCFFPSRLSSSLYWIGFSGYLALFAILLSSPDFSFFGFFCFV